jgi:hypothetical protein
MELKRFITVLTTARYPSLSCAKFNPVKASPFYFSKNHLIVSFHPGIGVQSCLFTFPHQTAVFISLSSLYVPHAPPTSLSLFHHSNNRAWAGFLRRFLPFTKGLEFPSSAGSPHQQWVSCLLTFCPSAKRPQCEADNLCPSEAKLRMRGVSYLKMLLTAEVIQWQCWTH